MIITLTPNPAIDQTIWTERFTEATTTRYWRWELDPAGKGINVSRMVHRLGHPTMAFGFLAGETGLMLQSALEQEGVPHHFERVAGRTRINVVIVNTALGDETGFYGPGPKVGRESFEALDRVLQSWLEPGRLLVMGGSLPPGLQKDAFEGFIRQAKARGVLTILNTSGEALRLGIRAEPDLVKLTVTEAEELLGRALPDVVATVDAARELIRRGVRMAVITMGLRGTIGVQDDRTWWVVPPVEARVRKVGSGDSLVAGLAVALATGGGFTDGLRLGTAAAAATAMSSGTSLGSAEAVQRFLPRVLLEDVTEVAIPSEHPPRRLPEAEPAPVAAEKEGAFTNLARFVGRYVSPRASEPPKRPVGPRERLRYGMDIDGTITQAPRHFKRLIDALMAVGDYVCILTARLESTRVETEALLAALGIHYDELLMRPDDWPYSIADYKVQQVRDRELHLLMDDDPRNCWAVIQRTDALAGHMLPIPETPEEEEMLIPPQEQATEPV